VDQASRNLLLRGKSRDLLYYRTLSNLTSLGYCRLLSPDSRGNQPSELRQNRATGLRRVRLAAFFEFLERGLELGEHKLAVFWDVGDDDLPICDGVGFVAEGGVAAS